MALIDVTSIVFRFGHTVETSAGKLDIEPKMIITLEMDPDYYRQLREESPAVVSLECEQIGRDIVHHIRK